MDIEKWDTFCTNRHRWVKIDKKDIQKDIETEIRAVSRTNQSSGSRAEPHPHVSRAICSCFYCRSGLPSFSLWLRSPRGAQWRRRRELTNCVANYSLYKASGTRTHNISRCPGAADNTRTRAALRPGTNDTITQYYCSG